MTEYEKKRDEELLARAKAWSVTVPRINEYTSKEDMEEIYIEGYTEGKEAAFWKVCKALKDNYINGGKGMADFLIENKDKIIGDAK